MMVSPYFFFQKTGDLLFNYFFVWLNLEKKPTKFSHKKLILVGLSTLEGVTWGVRPPPVTPLRATLINSG